MKELELYRKAMIELPKGILEAEAEAEKNDVLSAGVINGKAGGMAASDKTAIFVRVSGEKTGLTYTQNLEEEPAAVMLEALKNAEYVQDETREKMNPKVLASGSEVKENKEIGKEERDKEEKHIPFSLLREKAMELEKAIRSCGSGFSHISVQLSENLRSVGIVNSLGLDRNYTRRITEAKVSITCEEGCHRSLELETSAAELDKIHERYFTDRIREWMNLPQNEIGLSENTMPAVLDGTVLCNILITAWQLFSGYQYGNRSTPLYGKLNTKICSEAVTLIDIPDSADNGYGRVFDCEGSACKRVEVVKDGVFCGLMHNLKTAALLGTDTTGNAGRDISLLSDQTEVKVIPSNFALNPGPHRKEDLLSELSDGIYIYESFDMFHSINLASGDFAIPCKGILYQKGKAAGKAEGVTISGNILELFQSITKVADDTASFSVVMSKSYQVMSPSVLVKSIYVSG